MRSSERGKPPLPSQVGRVMGIFPFALGLFLGRISLITVQTAFFFFYPSRKKTLEGGSRAQHYLCDSHHPSHPRACF